MKPFQQPRTNESAARDDLGFLTSSWNRLDVLYAIATTPRSRDELRDHADISRVTLSRILSDLESRGWIERTDDGYAATRAGAYVSEEVVRTVDNLRTLNRLGENVSWMQLERFDFELARLEDAEIIMPTWDDFSAQTATLVDLVYDCRRIRGIGTGMDRSFMRALADATMNGDLTVELVFKPTVVEAIADIPELARLFRDLTDADDAAIYRYAGNAPLMELGINETKGDREDIVMLCGDHEEGAPPGTVKSTDPAVWSWAESFFADRVAESRPLEPVTFTS